MDQFGQIPPSLKPCQCFMRLAADHDKIDPVVSYWCRLFALQLGLKIDSKDKNNRTYLLNVMTWLEEEKQRKQENEAISNEIVAQAHLDNYAHKLFSKADSDDRAGQATKNTSILFLKVSQLFDAMGVFGELSDEIVQKSKYAKWRAAYISKCLKNGDKPLPPETEEGQDEATNSSTSAHFENEASSSTILNDFTQDLAHNLPSSSSTNPSSDTSNLANYYNQPAPVSAPVATTFTATNGVKITQEDILKGQKYCKWAGSALQFEDVPTAVLNLQRALCLLTTGKEMESF